jgi:hypothetical protein
VSTSEIYGETAAVIEANGWRISKVNSCPAEDAEVENDPVDRAVQRCRVVYI